MVALCEVIYSDLHFRKFALAALWSMEERAPKGGCPLRGLR